MFKKTMLSLAAIVLGFGLMTGSAWADKKVGEFIDEDDDGSVWVFEVFQAANGKYWAIVHRPDGSHGAIDIGYTAPDDPNNGKGTNPPDVEGELKKVHDAYTIGKNIEDTPLGTRMNGRGQGFNPVGNPGDADGWEHGPGNAPDHSNDYKKTPEQLREGLIAINLDARARFNMASGMSGYGDSGEDAPGLGNHGSGNTHQDDDADFRDGQNHTIGDTYDLGPHPELINPNPEGPLKIAP